MYEGYIEFEDDGRYGFDEEDDGNSYIEFEDEDIDNIMLLF